MADPVKLFGPETSSGTLTEWSNRLDGVEYLFRQQWIERCDRWNLQVRGVDGVVLIAGMRVVADWDLLLPYTDTRLPPGRLTCKDSNGLHANPTRDDFQERHYYIYESPDPEVDDRDLTSTPFVPEEEG